LLTGAIFGLMFGEDANPHLPPSSRLTLRTDAMLLHRIDTLLCLPSAVRIYPSNYWDRLTRTCIRQSYFPPYSSLQGGSLSQPQHALVKPLQLTANTGHLASSHLCQVSFTLYTSAACLSSAPCGIANFERG
jgi:hypothetical protein